MAYGKYRRYSHAKATPRVITVRYDGMCACCGAVIRAGEVATYYPVGTLGSRTEGAIAHVGGPEGNSARCTMELRKSEFPEYHAELVRKEMERRESERRAVNDYAGAGLDARWEDDCRDVCGA